MNYLLAYPAIGIIKTTRAADNVEVFGDLVMARRALALAINVRIAAMRAALKAACKVREKDLPVEGTKLHWPPEAEPGGMPVV